MEEEKESCYFQKFQQAVEELETVVNNFCMSFADAFKKMIDTYLEILAYTASSILETLETLETFIDDFAISIFTKRQYALYKTSKKSRVQKKYAHRLRRELQRWNNE